MEGLDIVLNFFLTPTPLFFNGIALSKYTCMAVLAMTHEQPLL